MDGQSNGGFRSLEDSYVYRSGSSTTRFRQALCGGDTELKVKESKCLWNQPRVEYLGHIILAVGVKVDLAKVQNMMQWQILKTLKELQGFLGLTSYYRRFVANYRKIAAPLTRCGEFHWTEVRMKAFEALKKAITIALVLALPNFTKPFVVKCDALGTRIRVVLMQEGRLVAYMSKTLSMKNQMMSTYE
ncbi:uncharacterized mitochondrial protein AtMg00860-like [Typha angustifolia]|uniref:uncharacterized mitochondrial protein AtMg00860-like n=1 Tax=Typha angustifolia TaxID=59011 RepID=UPI003C2FCBA9